MKKWVLLLDILLQTWEEDCPSQYKWHFRKNSLKCDFDWRDKTFRFYK